MMYYDGARLCNSFKPQICNSECDENTHDKREDYAKIALMMFYPFRKLEDLQLNGSYWNLFFRELQLFKKNERTTMWKKGFDILQNIENRRVLQCHTLKRQDHITRNTINKLDTDITQEKRVHCQMKKKILPTSKGKSFVLRVTGITMTSTIEIFEFYEITNFLSLFWAPTRIMMTNTTKILNINEPTQCFYVILTSCSCIFSFSLGLMIISSMMKMSTLMTLTVYHSLLVKMTSLIDVNSVTAISFDLILD